jgi:hypothetical protein
MLSVCICGIDLNFVQIFFVGLVYMEKKVELQDREEQQTAHQQVQLAESEQDNRVERDANHDKELQCSPYYSQISN